MKTFRVGQPSLVSRLCLLTCVVLLTGTPAVAQENLAISPSGHYFVWRGKAVVLVGDSGTQCVAQNANLDFRSWLDDCAAAGLSAVHVWSFVAARQKQDGSVVERRYGYVYPGLTPWARRRGGPLAFDGLPRYDLTKFDERYWARLRDMCRYAKEKGLVFGITVFFGWPKWNTRERPDWSYHPFNIINGGFLVTKDSIVCSTQIIDAPGKEVLREKWSDTWPAAKKTQWVWERFAERLIEETRPFGNVFFVFMDEHSYSEGNCGDHFARFFRKRGALWVDWDRRREMVDAVFSPTFTGTDKNANAVKGFRKLPPRPYMHLEGGPYKGDGVRTALWTFLVGGGHYFFHDDAGMETITTGVMQYDPKVKGADKKAHARRLRWLGYASKLFNKIVRDVDSLAPCNALVRSPKTYCLAGPREYVIYSLTGKEIRVDLPEYGGTKLIARFYNPRTGKLSAPQPFKGNVLRLNKPDGRDWVLFVRRQE